MKISIKALAHAMSLRPLFIRVLIDHFTASEGHASPFEDPEYALSGADVENIAHRLNELLGIAGSTEFGLPNIPALKFAAIREVERAIEDFVQFLNVLGAMHLLSWDHSSGYRPRTGAGVQP